MKRWLCAALVFSGCAHATPVPPMQGTPGDDGRVPLSTVISASDNEVWAPSVAYPTLEPTDDRHAPHTHMGASGPLRATGWLAFQAYQATFSRLDGSTCRFRPTCSGFGLEAVREAGLWGVGLTFARLQRNHAAAKHYPTSTPPFLDDPLANYRFTSRRPQLDDFAAYDDPAHAWYQHVRAAKRVR